MHPMRGIANQRQVGFDIIFGMLGPVETGDWLNLSDVPKGIATGKGEFFAKLFWRQRE